MPKATYEELLGNLRETVDPPVPQRTTLLIKPEGETRARHIATNCMIAALFGLIAGAFFYYSHWIVGGIFGLLTVLMLMREGILFLTGVEGSILIRTLNDNRR